jgi:hypothetical protein
MKGEWEMGGETMTYRHEITVVSEKEMKFRAHHMQGGQEHLVMEFTYTRK